MSRYVRFVVHRWVGNEQERVPRGSDRRMDQILRRTACGQMKDWASVTRNEDAITCRECLSGALSTTPEDPDGT